MSNKVVIQGVFDTFTHETEVSNCVVDPHVKVTVRSEDETTGVYLDVDATLALAASLVAAAKHAMIAESRKESEGK